MGYIRTSTYVYVIYILYVQYVRIHKYTGNTIYTYYTGYTYIYTTYIRIRTYTYFNHWTYTYIYVRIRNILIIRTRPFIYVQYVHLRTYTEYTYVYVRCLSYTYMVHPGPPPTIRTIYVRIRTLYVRCTYMYVYFANIRTIRTGKIIYVHEGRQMLSSYSWTSIPCAWKKILPIVMPLLSSSSPFSLFNISFRRSPLSRLFCNLVGNWFVFIFRMLIWNCFHFPDQHLFCLLRQLRRLFKFDFLFTIFTGQKYKRAGSDVFIQKICANTKSALRLT